MAWIRVGALHSIYSHANDQNWFLSFAHSQLFFPFAKCRGNTRRLLTISTWMEFYFPFDAIHRRRQDCRHDSELIQVGTQFYLRRRRAQYKLLEFLIDFFRQNRWTTKQGEKGRIERFKYISPTFRFLLGAFHLNKQN